MSASEAMIGYGGKFAIGNGATPEVFADLAEVMTVTPPSIQADLVDVTHMQSPDRTREYTDGLKTPGECTIEMNFIPGSDADEAIRSWQESGGVKNCRITYPNDATWNFAARFRGYEVAMPNDDKMTATLTVQMTGSYVAA